jgi:autotransporter-associated beta strand protein
MNITGEISGYTGTIFCGANVTFTGLSSHNATTVLQQNGIYTFNSIKNVNGGASSLGNPTTVATGTIGAGNLANSFTFRYIGTGDTTDRVINLRGTTGTVTLEQAGSGLLKFTSALTATGGGVKTLNLAGSTSGTGELAGAIVNNSISNTTAVSKSGAGKWTLSGASTYSGTTSVNAGTLIINGDQTAASGAVNVAADATLGGVGILGGNTTLTDNGKLEFGLSTAPGSHDKLELAAGKTLSFGANATLTITSSGGATTGLYTLVTAPGGIGTLPAFTVNLPAGWTASPPAVSGNDLVINITSTGGSAYDTWKAANAPGSNPGDDTDGDGVTNAVEFVLGGTSATRDLDKLPTTTTGITDMTFTFNRAVSSIDPKTALFIETSTDLVNWNIAPSPYSVPDTAVANNPGVTVVEDTSIGFDTVTLTISKWC